MMMKMAKIIKVLVVDDSAVMRKLISEILDEHPEIEVIGTAKNGVIALELVSKLQPDVVTMDIEMPKMDGLTAVQHLMNENPIPVIMISAMDKRQADITMKALEFGAVDFISKTSGTLSLDIDKKKSILISKVKTAAGIRVSRLDKIHKTPLAYPKLQTDGDDWIVTIGASTGGPKAIPEVLSRLPRNLPAAILIVQHMPEGFTRSFAERLNWYTSLEVKEAEEAETIVNGKVYIAPGEKHMEVYGNEIHLSNGPPVNYVRPSADILMTSAAKSYGSKCIGVLLTGMGSDGGNGLKVIKEHGGKTIVQNEETCVVYGMPKAAVNLRVADTIVPLQKIANNIILSLEG
jgi:two-component system chemotaxis response regulator CheB